MTSARPLCDLVCDALLDPTAPRPPGMDDHLAACATCRRLRDAHGAAERLAPAPGSARAPAAVRMDEVLARVSRRRRARAAGAAAAAALALAIGLRLTASPPEPSAGGDLFALADSVSGYATRDVGAEDPALRAYPALAAWLAPPALRSLELPSLSLSPPPPFGAAAGGATP